MQTDAGVLRVAAQTGILGRILMGKESRGQKKLNGCVQIRFWRCAEAEVVAAVQRRGVLQDDLAHGMLLPKRALTILRTRHVLACASSAL